MVVSYSNWRDGIPVRGTWHGCRRADGTRTALLDCPLCDLVISLSQHSITATGDVFPSVVCPHDGCIFHENVRLEGWVPA